MAAHLEGKGCTVLDMTGLAQKGGAVYSHIRIARSPGEIHAVRIAAGGADLLLGCDLVVSASADALSKLRLGRSRAVVNNHETMTGDFTRDPDLVFPKGDLQRSIADAAGPDMTEFIDATHIATGLLGDSIASNLFMLGYAHQRGLLPITAEAIERAIALNGVAVEFNRDAFRWGRRAAIDLSLVEARAAPAKLPASHRLSETLDQMIERRVAFLTHYQNRAYAARYAGEVHRVREAESACRPGDTALTRAVAGALFKLMAYKDEYEVARLYAESDFLTRIADQFEGAYELRFHLAPPILGGRDPASAQAQLRSVGADPFPDPGETTPSAGHPFRSLRPERGTTDRTPADRRIRSGHRRNSRTSSARQSRDRGRIGSFTPGGPRLRSRQEGEPRPRQAKGSDIPWPLPLSSVGARSCGGMSRIVLFRETFLKTR